LGTYASDKEDVIRAIKRCVDVDSKPKNLNTGNCSFQDLNLAIQPWLELIVDMAGKQTSFLLKTRTRIQEIVLVVAPPDSSRSNFWTHGKIYRHFLSTEVSGAYTCMLCLNDVTEDNGPIKIWKNSKRSPHDPKNPTQGIVGQDAKTLLGS
jgi:hypothetical protein